MIERKIDIATIFMSVGISVWVFAMFLIGIETHFTFSYSLYPDILPYILNAMAFGVFVTGLCFFENKHIKIKY